MVAATEVTEQIRVLVADDQGVIRMGLAMILDHEPDLTTVAQAGDGEEALRLIEQYDPDVVLMDIRMPVMDGLVATERITRAAKESGSNRPAVLVLTTFDDEAYVLSAVRAGASGFLLKDTDPDLLVSAVRAVHRGDSLVDPASTRVLLERCVELERRVGGEEPAPAALPDAAVGGSAGPVERSRAGDPGLDGARAVEPRSRGEALRQRDDGENPRQQRVVEARAVQPGPGRRGRLRSRRGPPGRGRRQLGRLAQDVESLSSECRWCLRQRR